MKSIHLAGIIIAIIATTSAASEIEMTAPLQRDLTRLISEAGYNCPKAKIASFKGQNSRGAVFKIFCGPADRGGVYNNVAFEVIGRPDNTWRIRPWGE